MAFSNIAALLVAFVIVTILVVFVSKNRSMLLYQKGNMVYLGFLGIGIITVMDVLTSIFYAPGEAFRMVGYNAIFFMPLTAFLIATFAFSMTEIAQILERLEHKGGGVYNFSYLVFGRNVSLVAAASILVDYVNTAAISAISAVENIAAFSNPHSWIKVPSELAIIWGIAILNIIGIRDNIKVTYALFIFVCYSLAGLMALGIVNAQPENIILGVQSVAKSMDSILYSQTPFDSAHFVLIGVSSTILAYSGIESVLQTQKLAQSWRVIRQAYIFLIVFIGILTPVISFLALTQVSNPGAHAEDLMPTLAHTLGGTPFALLIIAVACATLAFAINTAMVASTELLGVIAEKFSIAWLVRSGRYGTHSKIIIFMAIFFSLVVVITNGDQSIVADMYAIGLVATFVLNLAALLVFRFTQGFSHIKEYKSNFTINIVLFAIFSSVFIYLLMHKQNGAMLWVASSALMLFLGLVVTKLFRDPELAQQEQFNSRFDVVSYIETVLEGSEKNEFHIVFARPGDTVRVESHQCVYITFGLQRLKAPKRVGKNHFVLSAESYWKITSEMESILISIRDWHCDTRLSVYFGWPTSSWRKRLYTGVLVNRILKMPARFPRMGFHIVSEPVT